MNMIMNCSINLFISIHSRQAKIHGDIHSKQKSIQILYLVEFELFFTSGMFSYPFEQFLDKRDKGIYVFAVCKSLAPQPTPKFYLCNLA
ncbi:hypothetical protein C1N70_27460 (plasmid) [Cytobacillus firmus]|uniref:Uncharacterized protein n=1 Tax=Cytobacillus oceanisediminis TaxID=665099 RepID=A0ABX3CM86_9BACI|nr:hypothetical protein BBV17_25585 [Cytobacillus oceanisediminis]